MFKRTATAKDVASVLGVSPASVQAYSRAGRIPFDTTPGGHRRYDVSEVQIALDSETAPVEPVPAWTSELTPLTEGLGRGVPTPMSEVALAARRSNTVRPEAPSTAEGHGVVGSTSISALAEAVAHSRSRCLTLLAR